MIMDTLTEIKELKKKKEKAQTLLTKHQTQLEALSEQRDQLVSDLQTVYGVTLETAAAEIDRLSAELDSKLQEARTVLGNINTD